MATRELSAHMKQAEFEIQYGIFCVLIDFNKIFLYNIV